MIIEFEMNEIMPACVMAEAHEKREEEKRIQRELERLEEERKAEERRRAEEEKMRKLTQAVMSSSLIPTINKRLLEYGWCRITIGSMDTKIDVFGNIDLYHSDKYDLMIDDISNNFLFSFLLEQYAKAGYKIGGWGTYSRNYYKDEERIIYAETNCETCEV